MLPKIVTIHPTLVRCISVEIDLFYFNISKIVLRESSNRPETVFRPRHNQQKLMDRMCVSTVESFLITPYRVDFDRIIFFSDHERTKAYF
jgi:hypothetical protein